MKKTATVDTDVMKSAVVAQRRGTEQDGAAATTLMQDAYRQLEEMIVTAQLAPGEMVSEAILSRRMGRERSIPVISAPSAGLSFVIRGRATISACSIFPQGGR